MKEIETWEEHDKNEEIMYVIEDVIRDLDELYQIDVDYDLTDMQQLRYTIKELIVDHLVARELLKED